MCCLSRMKSDVFKMEENRIESKATASLHTQWVTPVSHLFVMFPLERMYGTVQKKKFTST